MYWVMDGVLLEKEDVNIPNGGYSFPWIVCHLFPNDTRAQIYKQKQIIILDHLYLSRFAY